MSATQKKCDMKRVQHEATREKLHHEESARVKPWLRVKTILL